MAGYWPIFVVCDGVENEAGIQPDIFTKQEIGLADTGGSPQWVRQRHLSRSAKQSQHTERAR